MLAEMEAMEAGWVPGDTSAKNMDIAKRLADQADQGTYVHPDWEAKQAEVKGQIEADARAREADEVVQPQAAGLTPDETTELARLKSQLDSDEAALNDLLSDT